MFLTKLFEFLSRIFLFTGKLGKTRVFSFDKKLAPEKERELFLRLKSAKVNGTTDTESEEKLVRHNLRLVAHIGKKYNSPNLTSDDIISIGSIGLIKAVRTYDVDKGKNFSTYASRCIENEILMVLRSEKKLQNEVSLETSLGVDSDGNELTLRDILSDETLDLSEVADISDKLDRIKRLSESILSQREKEVIYKRFGLDGNPPKTQKIVARELKISRSYISRIEKTAIEKLKNNL